MKIQIIGASGTGKSSLAEYIARHEGVAWLDTDRYLWPDSTFTVPRPAEERLPMYLADREKHPDFVASGSIWFWHPEGFADRDLLVFLSLDEDERLRRLRAREGARGMAMEMGPDGEPTNSFIEWCKTYHTDPDPTHVGTRAEHEEQIRLAKSPVLRLDSAAPLDLLYRRVLEVLGR